VQNQESSAPPTGGFYRGLLIDVGLGIGLGVLFALARLRDDPSGPLPYIESTATTLLAVGAVGLIGLLALIPRSTRRVGRALLIIALISGVIWQVARSLI